MHVVFTIACDQPCLATGKTQPVLANPFQTVDDQTWDSRAFSSLDEHHIPAGTRRRNGRTDQLDVVVTVNGQVLLMSIARGGGASLRDADMSRMLMPLPQVSTCESIKSSGCTFQYLADTPSRPDHGHDSSSSVWNTPVVFAIWPKAVTEGGKIPARATSRL